MNIFISTHQQSVRPVERGERSLTKFANVRLISFLIWLLLMGVVWCTAAVVIRAERRSAKSQAEDSARELVQTYEAHIVRALREIDRTLLTVEYASEIGEPSVALGQLRERGLLPPHLLFEVAIADAQGAVIAGTRSVGTEDVSEEDYFLKARVGSSMFISDPQLDRKTGEWRLWFSRRLDDREGAFAGIVFIAVEAAYFVSSYEPLKLGQGGMLELVGSDHVVRARRIGDVVTAGGRMDWEALAPHTEDDSTPAVALVISGSDGVTRFVSTRRLGMYPATVVVGLARDEELAYASERTRAYVGVAVLVSLIVSGVVVALARLTGKLLRSRQREQEMRVNSARESGMAEIATNVLHNVGNSLNSVNVSATLLADTVKNSKVSGLAQAAELLQVQQANLREFLTQDARGKHVTRYLSQLAESLQADKAACTTYLTSLREGIEHIKNIVAMQQTLARPSALKEEADPVEIMEAGLQMNADAFGRHNVEVVREFDKVPLLVLDKHGVLQILINLISNAKHACNESGRHDKRIIVRVQHRANAVLMSVTDNGVGIPAENITRIFNHGFTTRAKGHGFGLHSSALAAKDLGGSLDVQSDGIGQGATFTLTLPLTTVRNVA